MSNSSQVSILFFVAALACGGPSSNDSPPPAGQEAQAARAPTDASARHAVDNAATEKVEADRNERQHAADKQTHAAYVVSTRDRLAKLDQTLAKITTSKNAAGLVIRRDRLATRLDAMPASVDPAWVAYTSEVNSTFDGIERDLRAAQRP